MFISIIRTRKEIAFKKYIMFATHPVPVYLVQFFTRGVYNLIIFYPINTSAYNNFTTTNMYAERACVCLYMCASYVCESSTRRCSRIRLATVFRSNTTKLIEYTYNIPKYTTAMTHGLVKCPPQPVGFSQTRASLSLPPILTLFCA